MKTYSEKLKDPRWQRKRLEIMQRDNFACTQCGDTSMTQNVHHWQYSKEPWDAKNEDLTTVCRSCHEEIEKCKELTKDFLRQSDFRMLLKQIETLLKTNPVRVITSQNSVAVIIDTGHQMPLPSVALEALWEFDYFSQYDPDEKGYRYLRFDESYKIGDQYWDDGWQVITRLSEDNYVCMSPDMRYRRKYKDALSAFDRLIESSPDEDKEA
jgi:hypothetical protein